MNVVEASRILVIPDLHVPLHDRPALKSICEFASKNSWDYVVQLGDLLDLESAGVHSRGKPLLTEGQRLVEDYTSGRKVLKEIADACTVKNPACEKVLICGNHENRIAKFCEEHSWLDGAISVERGLQLAETGWRWVPYDQIFKVGSLHFTHGRYCGVNAVRKHAMRYQVNLIIGHMHSIGMAAVHRLGDNSAIVARSLGHLGPPSPRWRHGDPSDWRHAFGVAMVCPQGKNTVTVVEVDKGRFVGPDGMIYGGGSIHGAQR